MIGSQAPAFCPAARLVERHPGERERRERTGRSRSAFDGTENGVNWMKSRGVETANVLCSPLGASSPNTTSPSSATRRVGDRRVPLDRGQDQLGGGRAEAGAVASIVGALMR